MTRDLGTISITEETIREIVRRILAVCDPDRVILFGSAATGAMTTESDIDLLVVEPRVEDAREEAMRLREALKGIHFPIDVIVMSSERFDETRGVIGGIAFPARYGKVIYEAA